MSPQRRRNVLHVACIQKLNIYRHHVSCISDISPVSGVKNRPLSTCIHKLDMFNCWTHVSSRSKDAGHSFCMSPQRGQERSTCRHFINIHEFTRSRIVIRMLLASFYFFNILPHVADTIYMQKCRHSRLLHVELYM